MYEQALVKWSGFGPEYNTWEPIKQIPSCFLGSPGCAEGRHKALQDKTEKNTEGCIESTMWTGKITSSARNCSGSDEQHKGISRRGCLYSESPVLWPIDNVVAASSAQTMEKSGHRPGLHSSKKNSEDGGGADEEAEQQLFRDELRALLLETCSSNYTQNASLPLTPAQDGPIDEKEDSPLIVLLDSMHPLLPAPSRVAQGKPPRDPVGPASAGHAR